MSQKLKSYLLKYGIGTLVCAGIVAMHMLGFDFQDASQKDILCCWADAFTVAGVLPILSGLLMWVSNEGAFHGVGYCLSSAGKALIPGGRLGKMETYAEYLDRKSGKKKTGFGFLYILGGVFLAIGVVFLVIYNMM